MRGKAGIGKLALYGREYFVAVKPYERGLVMYTMRHAQEVRRMSLIEELEHVPRQVKPEELKLAKQIVGSFEGRLDLGTYRDEYQAELRRVIDAKVAGDQIVAPVEEPPAKVVNLMDALRKSLDSVSAEKKRPARVDLAKRSAVAQGAKKRRA